MWPLALGQVFLHLEGDGNEKFSRRVSLELVPHGRGQCMPDFKKGRGKNYICCKTFYILFSGLRNHVCCFLSLFLLGIKILISQGPKWKLNSYNWRPSYLIIFLWKRYSSHLTPSRALTPDHGAILLFIHSFLRTVSVDCLESRNKERDS